MKGKRRKQMWAGEAIGSDVDLMKCVSPQQGNKIPYERNLTLDGSG